MTIDIKYFNMNNVYYILKYEKINYFDTSKLFIFSFVFVVK